MMLVAVGLNHQTAPIALRERVAVAPESLAQAAAALRATPGVLEAVVVSTCNRTEIYCSVEPGAQAAPAAWLHEFHGLRPSQLDEFLYRHVDSAMVRHLFRVATGLDSMVLGEPQVLGQVKESWQRAREAGSLGNRLDRLFQNAFAVAKRARTETRVGAAPVSVAFAATRLAGQVYGDLAGVSALLVGAGDTIELVARHLVQTGLQRMTVANRTMANAEALAAHYDARAISLPDLPRHLHEADLVICSTAAREPVISRADVQAALAQRRHRPMLFVDLAVPRDVDPGVATLDDVFLYTVDDLAAVIEDNLRSRREAALEAEAIIDLQVEHYGTWLRAQDGHGPLRALRRGAERQRDAVLARARQMLAAGRNPDEVLQYLASTLTNRLMHPPTSGLRSAAERGDAELLRAGERLFEGLDRDPDESP
ncbi:MAG TPA: glutamyl-tRNA reductase [Pseudomonadota bacterium]|nr:glutamyl-tRNA reductase [Xanthomonadales bacterium]HQY35399.1 glutamyl-tRNA reductase [Pseudomonadota bacterium]HRA36807.1 glutamyl-tRNA reductase [Pseudomonadota bacterium]